MPEILRRLTPERRGGRTRNKLSILTLNRCRTREPNRYPGYSQNSHSTRHFTRGVAMTAANAATHNSEAVAGCSQACSTLAAEDGLEGAETETSAHEAQTWSLSSQSHLAGVRVRVSRGEVMSVRWVRWPRPHRHWSTYGPGRSVAGMRSRSTISRLGSSGPPLLWPEHLHTCSPGPPPPCT